MGSAAASPVSREGQLCPQPGWGWGGSSCQSGSRREGREHVRTERARIPSLRTQSLGSGTGCPSWTLFSLSFLVSPESPRMPYCVQLAFRGPLPPSRHNSLLWKLAGHSRGAGVGSSEVERAFFPFSTIGLVVLSPIRQTKTWGLLFIYLGSF